MKSLLFRDAASLAEYMVGNIKNRHYIVAALFFDEAQDLLRELLLYEDIEIGSIEIDSELFDGYCGEYYVSLTDENILSVEKAFYEDAYLTTEAELMLIDSDASSRILRTNSSSEFIEIEIDNTKFEEIDHKPIYTKSTYSELYDELFDTAELIYDDHGNMIGANVNAKALFNFLFQ